MPSRVIYLTVDLPQEDPVQEIRNRFDPLSATVPPHITVVFPFDSEIDSEDLIALIDESVEELEFEYVEISLESAIIVKEFCFFPIDAGREEIVALHDRLYSTILEPFLADEEDYVPHITVGRCKTERDIEEIKDATDEVNRKATGSVRSIILERMNDDDSSRTEYERKLRPDDSDA